VQPLWKEVWRFLKKLKIKLPYDPVILLLEHISKGPGCNRDTCTPMFMVTLFIIAKLRKQPRSPTTDEWIDKGHMFSLICGR
jgi:hypothetical protein